MRQPLLELGKEKVVSPAYCGQHCIIGLENLQQLNQQTFRKLIQVLCLLYCRFKIY
jgi:hypothetical protein